MHPELVHIVCFLKQVIDYTTNRVSSVTAVSFDTLYSIWTLHTERERGIGNKDKTNRG